MGRGGEGGRVRLWVEKGAIRMPPVGSNIICVGPGTGLFFFNLI